MNQPVITTTDLTRRFGANTAVDCVTICIDAGDIFGCLGHNGAGKTTTVRLLNGVLTPSSGAITVLGMDPVTHGPEVRARTGVLTETPSLDDRLTARATLRLYAEMFGVPRERVAARVNELLDLFELGPRAGDKVGGFSKGMRQRMALARTLLHAPEIIFLDEPTAALDPVATREVHQLIRDAATREGRTVFLCTHNLYEAERLCTRVAVLAQGRLLAMGSPAALARRYGPQQRLVLEVGAGQQALAAETLRALPFALTVGDVENGPQARVGVQGLPHEATPQAIAALTAAGVALYAVVREEATLEDVYFALQDAHAGAAESLPTPAFSEQNP